MMRPAAVTLSLVFISRQQSVVFVLDLVGRVGFGELRQVERIAEALRELFESHQAAGTFVFGGRRCVWFGHPSILSNCPAPWRIERTKTLLRVTGQSSLESSQIRCSLTSPLTPAAGHAPTCAFANSQFKFCERRADPSQIFRECSTT